MVELPKYVHKVTKRRVHGQETVYFFYTRHKNTKMAWPSIALPDPFDARFSERITICEALERDGKGFYIYGTRLPDHKDKSFWEIAAKRNAAILKMNRDIVKDFRSMVESFQDDTNPFWKDLAPATRRGYKSSGAMIIKAWGDDMPADLTTVDAQQAIDALGETPATANQFRAFLSRLMSWGIPRGYCTTNPVEHTDKIPGGEPWTPWPNWAFEILFAHAPMNMQMICMSAFFTGQRQGDVLRMPFPKLKENIMEVRAQKTGKTVWIPIHSEYKKLIEKAPRGDTMMLHVGARGLPFKTADGFRTEWGKLMDTKPFAPFRQNRIVFHGLRKNAVINLLEAGCSESEVGSICNMSAQMVQHYGKDVSARALAKNAMKLLEKHWKAIEPEAFKRK